MPWTLRYLRDRRVLGLRFGLAGKETETKGEETETKGEETETEENVQYLTLHW